jgi:plastocyanin domain-containing protein
MNKIALSIISTGFIIGLVIIFSNGVKIDNRNLDQNVKNSYIEDDIQYININARGGYFPRISKAQSNLPTKIIVKTNGTYDCSAALKINSIGYQKILPQTGETVIDIGIPKSGDSLQGVCAMGMYSFLINFN